MENNLNLNLTKSALFHVFAEIPKDTRKGIRYFAYFLAFMLALTLLSNAANGVTIAKVTAVYPSTATVSDEISVTGTITAASKLIVSAPDDMRVEKIIANTGSKVKKEDALLIFDTEDLTERMKEKQADLTKLEAELYVTGISEERTDHLDSYQDASELEAAQAEYEALRERTQRAIDKAAHEYEEANRAYTRARVDYRNSGNSSDVMSAMMRLDRAETQLEEARMEYDRKQQIYNTALANGDSRKEAARQEMAEAKKKYAASDKKYQLALDHYDDAIAESGDEDNGGNSRQDYENLRSIRNRVYDAKAALEEAELDQQKDLEDALRKIREQENRNEISEITRQNAQQSKRGEQVRDSAEQEALLLGIEQKKKEIEILTRFLNAEGKLFAPAEGTLMALNLDDDRTLSGKEAVQIATAAEGYEIPVKIDSEAAKDVTAASKVLVNIGSEKIDGQISSIATYPDEDKMIALTIKLPEASYQDGQSAEVIIQKQQAQYDLCIPLGALRNDNSGDFVYLLDETKTILGLQTTLRKVPIEVHMKDDKMAAISGAVGSDSQILIASNKMVEGGDRVRLLKN